MSIYKLPLHSTFVVDVFQKHFAPCSALACCHTITYSPSIFCFRLINPVVVSPTIAAIGLSFFSYGFTRVGTCLEIGVVQILLVVIFSLVSRAKISSNIAAAQFNYAIYTVTLGHRFPLILLLFNLIMAFIPCPANIAIYYLLFTGICARTYVP